MVRRERKNRARNVRYEVDKFARGTEVTIVEWIVQMDSFQISRIQSDEYVGFML